MSSQQSSQNNIETSENFRKCCCGRFRDISPSCGSSIIFLGFIAFYLLSFLWDVFALRGSYLSLSMSQMPHCINRTNYYNITPTLILSLLFVICFHSISLVWIIGYVHSKQISGGGGGDILSNTIIDVPSSMPHKSFMIPFLLYDLTACAQFGLSLYIYLFLSQLIENESEIFVNKFCISYELVEESYEWLQISLFFFIGVIILGYLYCCLIRIAANDASIIQDGQQTFIPAAANTANDATPAAAAGGGGVILSPLSSALSSNSSSSPSPQPPHPQHVKPLPPSGRQRQYRGRGRGGISRGRGRGRGGYNRGRGRGVNAPQQQQQQQMINYNQQQRVNNNNNYNNNNVQRGGKSK